MWDSQEEVATRDQERVGECWITRMINRKLLVFMIYVVTEIYLGSRTLF